MPFELDIGNERLLLTLEVQAEIDTQEFLPPITITVVKTIL